MTIRIELDSVEELENLISARTKTEQELEVLRNTCEHQLNRIEDIETEKRTLVSHAYIVALTMASGKQDSTGLQSILRQMLTDILSNSKIAVIKTVREMTGLGLKEAKELVEAAMSDAAFINSKKSEEPF